MIGSWKWNIWFAGIGMLMTLFFSWSNNPFATALFGSLYTFVILFFVMYVIRWILGTVIGIKQLSLQQAEQAEVGQHIDLQTPEDDKAAVPASEQHEEANAALANQQKEEQTAAFSPLNPPKLAKKSNLSDEELAEVVRHMADEEGR